MLRRLTVRNLAIVEDLDLEFGPGLTVISGETGAGEKVPETALRHPRELLTQAGNA